MCIYILDFTVNPCETANGGTKVIIWDLVIEKNDEIKKEGDVSSGLFDLLIKNDKLLHFHHVCLSEGHDWLTRRAG